MKKGITLLDEGEQFKLNSVNITKVHNIHVPYYHKLVTANPARFEPKKVQSQAT